MGIAADLFALVRGRTEVQSDLGGGEDGCLVTNPRGDLLIAKALPDWAELSRMRCCYVGGYTDTTAAVAPLVALPTTAAGAGTLTMFNGEQDNGKIYVLQGVWAYCNASITAATALQVALMITIGKFSNATAIVNDLNTDALAPKGTAGQKYRGNALIDLAYAGTLTDDFWQPIGSSSITIADSLMHTHDAPLDGLFVLPPGHALHIAVIANTATATTVKMGLRWAEIQLPVG